MDRLVREDKMPDKIVWKIDDPKDQFYSHKTIFRTTAHPWGNQKNPALAFSLSLLFWGGGQLYNRQRELGLLFILLMAIFYTVLGLVAVYWNFMITSLTAVHMTYSMAVIAFGIFYLSGLIFWVFNSLHAYHQASMTQTDVFQGVQNPLLPLFCSLIVPGWGQFLNGQPKKGGCFLIFTLAGLFALPALMLIAWLWSTLETVNDRLLLERVLVIALALIPLVFLMWLVSVYDALKVCLDPLKKEPLRKRMKYAINRFRMKGWVRGFLSPAKPILMLGLFLVLSVTLSYYYFPPKNYVPLLQNLQAKLSQKQMVLLPHLINQFLQVTFPQEPQR
jgi:TM2 domain-containing membrane protein YozV